VIASAHASRRRLQKLTRGLAGDIASLLSPGGHFSDDDALRAFEVVCKVLISRINGDPWRSAESAPRELRAKRFPGLLYRSLSTAAGSHHYDPMKSSTTLRGASSPKKR
jgi:hypothetical protein